MAFHKRNTHGRAFHGEMARELMRQHKRDSHGNTPIMNVPEGFPPSRPDNGVGSDSDTDNGGSGGSPQPDYAIVYVTLPQTFAGPAVYSTLSDYVPAPTVAPPPMTTGNDDAQETYFPTDSGGPVVETPIPQTTAAVAKTTFDTSAIAPTKMAGTPLHGAAQATSSAGAIQQSSDDTGMSGGAKAGLAFGIILALGLVGALLFFAWRKKKAVNKDQQAMDEKHRSFADVGARRAEAAGAAGAGAGVAAAAGAAVAHNKRDSSMTLNEKAAPGAEPARTASTAPRLSLRPVTQFLPALGDNRGSQSTGNNLEVAAAGGKPKSAWERPSSANRQDPFTDAANQGRPESPPSDPFRDQRASNESLQGVNPANAGAIAAAAVAAAGVGGGSSAKHTPKPSWEGSEPATPKSTHFGTAAAVAVGGGPRESHPPRQPNNVHRVQLDFKPSMDDELELRSGQLVRLLHEYDDGWVSIRQSKSLSITADMSRLFVCAWTVPNRVSRHGLACRSYL
jgi:hypothetical protein